MTNTYLIDKAMRYLELRKMEEPLWNIYHGLLDSDQEDTEEFKEIDLRLARIASEKDEQISLLLSEAPSYSDPDAFVSDMLTSSMFLDPEDEDAEIPTELAPLLYKIWNTAALPFKYFLACMDLTQTECSRRYCIPLRTVQGWAGGSRTPPMYVRYMIAQLELYLDL